MDTTHDAFPVPKHQKSIFMELDCHMHLTFRSDTYGNEHTTRDNLGKLSSCIMVETN